MRLRLTAEHPRLGSRSAGLLPERIPVLGSLLQRLAASGDQLELTPGVGGRFASGRPDPSRRFADPRGATRQFVGEAGQRLRARLDLAHHVANA